MSNYSPRGPQDWKKINLERRYWKKQAFNTEWNFQSRMKFSFRPLSGLAAEKQDSHFQSRMKISNREWTFQARMKISCLGEIPNVFLFIRLSENEFFDPRALWGREISSMYCKPTLVTQRNATAEKMSFNNKNLCVLFCDCTRELSAPKSQITAIVLHRGQIARKFRRKSAIFARNSQNETAIASDGNLTL